MSIHLLEFAFCDQSGGHLLISSIVKKVGFYLPFALLGDAISTIGGGLLSTLSPTTTTAKWAGYQFLAGSGRGMSFNLVNNGKTHPSPPTVNGGATNDGVIIGDQRRAESCPRRANTRGNGDGHVCTVSRRSYHDCSCYNDL